MPSTRAHDVNHAVFSMELAVRCRRAAVDSVAGRLRQSRSSKAEVTCKIALARAHRAIFCMFFAVSCILGTCDAVSRHSRANGF